MNIAQYTLLVCGALLASCSPIGCREGDPATPDAEVLRYEIVGERVCSSSYIADAYLVDGGFVVVCSGKVGEKIISRFDEASRTSTLIYSSQFPIGFDIRMVVGNIMYIAPLGIVGSIPELQALRLDAGATMPATIVKPGSHRVARIGVSSTYVYWDWADFSPSGVWTYGLSRALLSTGSEEDVALLPFAPVDLVVLGDDVYTLGHPHADDRSIALARTSTLTHTTETIFSEPPGVPRPGWIGIYQDHVLWSDTSAAPPKVYEIHGSVVQPDTSIRCPPSSRAVLNGDTLTDFDAEHCTPHNTARAIISTDLSTYQTSYYPLRIDSNTDLKVIGAREGWIYGTEANKLVRFRLLPF
jgi:hypothetical protein